MENQQILEHIRVMGEFDRKFLASKQSGLPVLVVTYGKFSKSTDYNIYFVNHSDEVLTVVESKCGGCQTIDDNTVMPVGGAKYSYKNVLPDEAVKIETYNVIYDSDFLLQLTVSIKSPRLGTITWSSLTKNKIPGGVILWEDGTMDKMAKRVEEQV